MAPKPIKLTVREQQVAELVVKGYKTKQVAGLLGITYGTAKLHLHNIYCKLEINNRVQLVHEFMSRKELRPPEEIDWLVAAE